MALIKDPAQRAVLDRVTAVMSLVEGHAEYVMDGVGPDVVPTVRRCASGSPSAARAAARSTACCAGCSGLEQKMKQYAEGRIFVGGVIDLRRHGGLQPGVGGPGEPAAASRS